MAIVTVGIDLAKNIFAVHGVDESGKPELVRPEVPRAKRGKNDAADAAAIAEALTRPNMPFVPVKSVEQQSRLFVHRARHGQPRPPILGLPSAPTAHVHSQFSLDRLLLNQELLTLVTRGLEPDLA